MPASRPPSRRYIPYLAYTFLAITLLLLLLPQIVSNGLVYGLGRIGVGAISVDNVDINLFTGHLAIDELHVYQSGARVFRLGHGELELDWHSLWQKRIQFQDLKLQNLSVTVEQPSATSLRIAGMPLPGSDEKTSTTAATKTVTPWGIGLENISLENVAVDFIRPGLAQSVVINSLSSGPLHSWEAESVTPLKAQLAMNDATLSMDARISPFAPSPVFDLKLQLSPFELASLRPLLPASLPALSGQLSLNGESRIQIASGDFTASLNGKLSGKAISVALPSNRLALSSASLNWQGNTRVAQQKGKLRISAAGDFSMQQIAASKDGNKTPHTRLNKLQLSGIVVHNLQDIQLDEIRLSGLQTTLQQTKNGLVPITTHQAAGTAAETTEASATPEQSPRLRINAIHLDGDSRIHFTDTTTGPRFEQTVSALKLDLGAIDTQAPSAAVPFSLQAMLGEHSQLTASGELTPFAQPPGVSVKAKLGNYEMPPLSPYLVRQLGYKINSGQLDSELQLSLNNNELNGKVHIKARQLDMEPEDPARIEEFEQQSSMPINTALGLLRDDKNNIKLDIPLSGNLSDPKFDFSDAINTALANTLRSGAVSYLKYLLQPYSSVISLVQLAGKAGGGVQLEPIAFAAGKAEPDPQTDGYIEKLAKLFQERENLQLRLCGIATTSDLLIISKGERKSIPPEGDEKLESLARQRAENIKKIMVERYGVSAAQLFICHPALENTEDAVPRVRLQL